MVINNNELDLNLLKNSVFSHPETKDYLSISKENQREFYSG